MPQYFSIFQYSCDNEKCMQISFEQINSQKVNLAAFSFFHGNSVKFLTFTLNFLLFFLFFKHFEYFYGLENVYGCNHVILYSKFFSWNNTFLIPRQPWKAPSKIKLLNFRMKNKNISLHPFEIIFYLKSSFITANI